MRQTNAARESGYAMLLVFLMAAMIAIALYNEIPRIAFEAQRAKEQLLIERGEQYKRAIQVFVRKMSRYPATIEELENTNNIRFLRKRYLDPMTGKEKWRLIHINGGVLTDSIIPKNKPGQGQDQQQPANTNTFIAEGPVLGAQNDPSQQQQINPAMRRRASDDRPAMAPDAPATPPPDTGDDSSASDSANANSDNADTPAPGTPAAAGTSNPTPGMAQESTRGSPASTPPTPINLLGCRVRPIREALVAFRTIPARTATRIRAAVSMWRPLWARHPPRIPGKQQFRAKRDFPAKPAAFQAKRAVFQANQAAFRDSRAAFQAVQACFQHNHRVASADSRHKCPASAAGLIPAPKIPTLRAVWATISVSPTPIPRCNRDCPAWEASRSVAASPASPANPQGHLSRLTTSARSTTSGSSSTTGARIADSRACRVTAARLAHQPDRWVACHPA